MATMATSDTRGWVCSSCSISATGTFSPPRLITSLTRPVMRTYPAALMTARSPLRYQPSAVITSAVHSGWSR